MNDKDTILKTRAKIIETIKSHTSFFVASHIRPDGDALGAMLATASLLKELGKKVILFNAGPIPDNLLFLPGCDKITNRLPDETHPEVALVLDSGNLDRIGPGEKIARQAKILINIDHHVSNDKFGDINLIEAVSSVGEQIVSLMHTLEMPIGKERAINLYTAIITDTGSFQFANTTEITHLIISRLLKEGIKPKVISEQLFQRDSFARQKLLGLALSTLKKEQAGKIVWFCLTEKMQQEAEAKKTEMDGFVDYLQTIRGAKLMLLFSELEKGKQTKVSIRSRNGVDANALAKKFGGGGHKQAAGCIIDQDIQSAEKSMLRLARENFGG